MNVRPRQKSLLPWARLQIQLYNMAQFLVIIVTLRKKISDRINNVVMSHNFIPGLILLFQL